MNDKDTVLSFLQALEVKASHLCIRNENGRNVFLPTEARVTFAAAGIHETFKLQQQK